uniref:Uncharacterized protein n=1 Tax=Arundo donax TaxID=35708 RepID=A0A0A9GM78_ARUDO
MAGLWDRREARLMMGFDEVFLKESSFQGCCTPDYVSM